MKKITLIIISMFIISCDNDGSNVQEECLTDDSNYLAGCWLYNQCYPSIQYPNHSKKTGIALGSDGVVLADFTREFDSADCGSNRNGYTALMPAGTYQTMGDFLNANGLNVTEFHYMPYSGVVKKTYYYVNNDELCFPVNSFMGDYDEFDVSMLNDSVSYNELNQQIDLTACFQRVDSF